MLRLRADFLAKTIEGYVFIKEKLLEMISIADKPGFIDSSGDKKLYSGMGGKIKDIKW